ncbi:MAG TPA: hypothetical protein DCG19_04285 [Cryomorphaceae bacterium]|nr:hypothetical protein [Cryomorphaceae bacterium]
MIVKLRSIVFIVSLMALLSSCQDVIEIDVPENQTAISITGRITDSKGGFAVVSTTANYFAQGETPKVEDARVLLFEDGIMVSEMQADSVPGLYTTTFNGSVGSRYEVEVEIMEGNPTFKAGTWRSRPEPMLRVFGIDSIRVRGLNRNTVPQVFTEGAYALMYFQEPPGRGDAYRVTRWKNDSLFTQSIFIFDDSNFDGRYIGDKNGIPPFNYFGPFDEKVGRKDSAGIEIASISRDYFDFLNLVGNQVFNVGSTFDPPPETIIGNIYNVSNPEEYGFGYFGASALSSGGARYKP